MSFSRLQVKIGALMCLLTVGAACESVLDPTPSSFTSTSNYYSHPDHFEAAINSAYSRLRNQAGISNTAFRTITELRFDCCITDPNRLSTSPSGKPIAEWYAAPSNEFFANQWSTAYHTIAQVNVVLGRIQSVRFDDQKQLDHIIGQALFIRALSYWYLVQMFGDVPLVLEEVRTPDDAVPAGRNSVEEVYQLISADLVKAIERLPPSWSQPGRASKGAAKFLLGKTHLLSGDYAGAAAILEEVVNERERYEFSLMHNFREIFSPDNVNNQESIFELQFGAGVAGQPHMNVVGSLLPYHSRGQILPATVGVDGDMLVSMQLAELYEDNDQRADATVHWWYDPAADSVKALLGKFIWPNHVNSQGQQAGNDILFRYADVLLSLAEAHWRLGQDGQAMDLVNRVRSRAGLDPIRVQSVPVGPLLYGTYLADDAVGRAIFNERTVEFAGEGHRMFDLIRFEVAFEVMSNWADRTRSMHPELEGFHLIEPHEILLPVPSQEISASGGALEQNPGW